MVNTEALIAKLQASLPSNLACIAELIFGIFCVGAALFFSSGQVATTALVSGHTVLLVLGGAALGHTVQAIKIRAKLSKIIAGANENEMC